MSEYDDVQISIDIRDDYAVISASVGGDTENGVTEDQVLDICEDEIDLTALSFRLKHAIDDTTEDTSDDETGIRSGKGGGWFSRVFL